MEVEVKYILKNPKIVIKNLNKIANKIKEKQTDFYYLINNKIIRLRKSESGIFIGYKKRIDEISCNNYSTKIRDFKEIKKILDLIGKKIEKIEKIRSTWNFNNYEIAIDKFKEKYFIEIESDKKINFNYIIKKIGANVGKKQIGYLELNEKKK